MQVLFPYCFFLAVLFYSKESKDFLQGQELAVAKEMIRAGIESVSGNVSDLDDFFDKQREKFSKKQTTIH